MSKKKILLFGSQSEIGQKIYEVLNEENLVIPLHRGFKFRKEHFELTYDSFDKAIEWCSFSKEYIYDADITIVDSAGKTPLLKAITTYNSNMDLDLGDGSTPRLKIVKMLLEVDSALPENQQTINVIAVSYTHLTLPTKA